MTTAEIRADYRAACLQTITVRRYGGSGKVDKTAAGNIRQYGADELKGTVTQGDRKVIVIVEDLVAGGLNMPLTTKDKVIDNGRECAIIHPGERKALDGTLIAYELQVRG